MQYLKRKREEEESKSGFAKKFKFFERKKILPKIKEGDQRKKRMKKFKNIFVSQKLMLKESEKK